ncbi:hypothetical protein [Pedobacter antarcticus]|uniref:hypothetical protein n=1 Tax=Pedobacter antarcticus TaxID=34086 RepID=UPI00292CD796|nr:hypothetical protein [Pedobacter antarcticus]
MNNSNIIQSRIRKFMLTVAGISGLLTFNPTTGSAQTTAKGRPVEQVSFQQDKFGRIFFPVKISRDTATLLFSTFGEPVRLSSYFQKTEELFPGWEYMMQTDRNGKSHRRLIFNLPKMEIGNTKVRSLPVLVNYAFPDSLVTGSTGTKMLSRYNWSIDNDNKKLAFSKGAFLPSNEFTAIPFAKNTAPQVSVAIDGIIEDFKLDLGSGASFQVNTESPLGQALLKKYQPRPSVTLTSTVHARKLVDTIYKIQVPELQFNGVTLKNQQITLSTAFPHHLVGAAFLNQYNIVINHSGKRKIGNSFILEERKKS